MISWILKSLLSAQGKFYKYKTSIDQKFVIIDLICSYTGVSFIIVVYGAFGATRDFSLIHRSIVLGYCTNANGVLCGRGPAAGFILGNKITIILTFK